MTALAAFGLAILVGWVVSMAYLLGALNEARWWKARARREGWTPAPPERQVRS